MAEANVLNQDELKLELNDVPEWEHKDKSIIRELSAANFAGAIGIVNAIAIVAEKADHHPDILVYGWNKVRITLSTHDKGGLTKKDFELAKEIDNLNF